MTTTTERNFRPIAHAKQPTGHGIAHVEYGIELALSIWCDNDDDRVLDYARETIGWPESLWQQRIDELLALAAECYEAELLHQLARLDVAVTEYEAALRALAEGPAVAELDRAIENVADVRPTLRAVKS